MARFNDFLSNAMVYTDSFGLTKEYTYEHAMELLLSPRPNVIQLARAENAIVVAHETTGSEAKCDIGVALCKSYGLVTDATTKQAQMQEAAGYLSAAAVEAAAEEDHSSFDVLKRVMESDYAKRIGLPEFVVQYILNDKKWNGTEYVYLACANMYGWGCPVNLEAAREFLEKNALNDLKEEYHKGIHRLLAQLDNMQ